MADEKNGAVPENENIEESFSENDAAAELSRIGALLWEEASHIAMPDSLSAENMLHMLDAEDKPQDGSEPAAEAKTDDEPAAAANTGETPANANGGKTARVVPWRRIVALAACFAVVIFGVSRMTKSGESITTAATTDASAIESASDGNAQGRSAAGEGSTAADYDEIYTLLADAAQDYGYTTGTANGIDIDIAVDDIDTDMAVTTDSAATMSSGAYASDSVAEAETAFAEGYTGTNTQVADVDESDIIKTDGKYLYHCRQNADTGNAQLCITDAESLEVLSSIDIEDIWSAELYIDGDTLVLLYDGDWGGDAPDGKVSDYVSDTGENDVIVPDWYSDTLGSATSMLVYDISDRTAPKKTDTFRQGGYYVSSRLADGVVYVVSNQYVDMWCVDTDAPAARVFPAISDNGAGEVLAADSIYLPSSLGDSASYCVVTAYDLADNKRETRAVLGSVDYIMMSGDTLLLTSTVYGDSWSDRDTGITRFDVGGDDLLTYRAGVLAEGWIDGQFSLDVANGLVRVATTSYNSDNTTVNNVFIYDENMEMLGSVTGLAEGERIYSVRYIGDTAYIVTFRETDPLFAIDLSDPENPTVLGQLKIPGFSTYLHPAGDGLLIGLGETTATTSYGSVITDGIKLSLFDISDPADPQEIDSVLLGNNGSSSDALDNHKAFMWDGANGRFGFPATLCRTYGATADNPWGTSSSVSFDGYLVYTWDDTGFTRVAALENTPALDPLYHSSSYDTIRRGVVINDTLYTVSDGGITAWSYSTFEKLDAVVY